jgi:AcrR family transcriptional regulator
MNKEKSKPDPDAPIERAAKPRDRIFACAQDLFHRRGIRGVGVEAIAEAAGTSKMALYRHFDSKDELIIEYLNLQRAKVRRNLGRNRGGKSGEPGWSALWFHGQGRDIHRRRRPRLRSCQRRYRIDTGGPPRSSGD